MDTLEGKVAVITGGASGIGFAMAERFGAAGAQVILADIERGTLDAAVEKLRAAGRRADGVIVDVSERQSVEALRARCLELAPKVHVLCNNAGVQSSGPLSKLSLDTIDWVLGVNLWGVIHGVKVFLPHMLEHGEPCHIVNTASAAGLITAPTMGAYCVSKHGVVALSECLAGEMAQEAPQVGVSVLCPGFVRTALHRADRNRPAALSDRGGMSQAEEDAFGQVVQSLVEAGKGPEEIAEAVYQAILGGKVMVLTHPDLKPVVAERFERILGEF